MMEHSGAKMVSAKRASAEKTLVSINLSSCTGQACMVSEERRHGCSGHIKIANVNQQPVVIMISLKIPIDVSRTALMDHLGYSTDYCSNSVMVYDRKSDLPSNLYE